MAMNARLDPVIERFRFAHHNVAMMFAMGMATQEVARKTGYTSRRLLILLNDPTFNELIEHYRRGHIERMHEALPTAIEDMEFCRVATVRQIREQLEEADEEGGEPIPIRDLVKIHGEMADRTGYSKHTLKTVISLDFATALDRAIERSGKGQEIKLIEGAVAPAEVQPSTSRAAVEVPRPRAFRRA